MYDSDDDYLPPAPRAPLAVAEIPRGIGVRVLLLRIKKVWFDMAASGARQEDVRRVSQHWDSRLAGREWDVVKLVNGYMADSSTHVALWRRTRIVNSYQVVAPNGVMYQTEEPHYVVEFTNL